jgi:DNA-binding NarL/FixJ family response regulator
MRVLIVDDSRLIAERVGTLLAEVSPEIAVVGRAADAASALRAFGELKPDVLVLDLRLPIGSGIEILAQVKRAAPAPVVMVLTNYPYPQYRKRCADLGADFFFDKSTEVDRLRGTFCDLLHAGGGRPSPP